MLAGAPAACPKAGACANADCPKTPVAEAPKAGLLKPALLTGAALLVCCPNRPGAVLAAACPNAGAAEGAVAVLLGSWLKAELELAAGGCVKTEEPEVTVPNTAVSAAGPAAPLAAVLEAEGAPDVSVATGPALGTVAAATAVGSGTEKVKVGGPASVLTSGAPVAAGTASAEGAARLELEQGLLTTGWARTGSLFPESEVCRGA